jgi:hypothetical protein
VAGSSTRGSVLERIALPAQDEHHMPPSDEPQLSSSQIALFAWFAKAGASAQIATSAAPAALVASGRARARAPKPSAAREPGASATQARPSDAKSEPPRAAVEGAAPSVRAILPARVDLYHDLAEPLLKARCADCHGGADPDGELRIADRDKLLVSGAVVPGDPHKSEIVVRMRTPSGKSDHMPPLRAPQIEAAEIDAIELWIARGAGASVLVDSAALSEPIAAVLAKLLAARPPASAASSPAAAPTTSEPARAGAAPPRVPPQHAGCAACSVGAASSPGVAEWLSLFAVLVVLGRRSLRPRVAAQRMVTSSSDAVG